MGTVGETRHQAAGLLSPTQIIFYMLELLMLLAGLTEVCEVYLGLFLQA